MAQTTHYGITEMPKTKYSVVFVQVVTYGTTYSLDKAIELGVELEEKHKVKGQIIMQENEKTTL